MRSRVDGRNRRRRASVASVNEAPSQGYRVLVAPDWHSRKAPPPLTIRGLSKVLFAHGAEVIVAGGHFTICVDGEMKVLVHQKIISTALTDNSEVIDKSAVELAVS